MSITYKLDTVTNAYYDFAMFSGWRYGVNGQLRNEAYDGVTTRNMSIRSPDFMENYYRKFTSIDHTTETFTYNSHGLSNGNGVVLMADTMPTNLVQGTVYYVVTSAANTFQLAAAPGGGAINFTSNGTNVYFATHSAPVYSAQLDGSLTAGTYYFRYTYYNATSNIESDPSSLSIAMTAGANPNDGITIILPPNPNYDTQTTHIKIYRTNVGLNTLYYDGQVAYTGANVTYNSTIADTGLGAVLGELDSTGTIQSFVNGIAPTNAFIELYNNRLFTFGKRTYSTGTVSVTQYVANHASARLVTGNGTSWTNGLAGLSFRVAGDTKIYTIAHVNSVTELLLTEPYEGITASGLGYEIYSDDDYLFYSYVKSDGTLQPESFPGDYWLPVNPGDGDEGSGLIKCNNKLLVCKKNSLYTLAGDSISTFVLMPIAQPTGCISGRTLCNDSKGNVLFLAYDGVYITDGGKPNCISGNIENIFSGTESSPFYVNRDRLADAHAVYDPINKRYWLWLSSSDSSITNKVLVADFNLIADNVGTPEWFTADIDANASVIVTDNEGKKWIYFGDEDGFIYRIDQDATNDGAGSGVNTRRGTVTASTASSLTDGTATFYTGGSGYTSVYVSIIAGTGINQRRKITSNTATTLNVSPNWTTQPDVTSTYGIGAINAYWKSKHFTWDSLKTKLIHYVKVLFNVKSTSYNLSVKRYENGSASVSETQYIDMSTANGYVKKFFTVNKARQHQFEVKIYDVDRPFTINQMEFEVKEKGKE